MSLLGHNSQNGANEPIPFNTDFPSGTSMDQFEGTSTSFNCVSTNMEKELIQKIQLEEKQEAAR